MKSILVGIFACFVAVALASEEVVHVAARSGDVILQLKEEHVDSSSLYFYYSQATPNPHHISLKETEISDFISFVVGGPSLESSKRKEFPSLLPFNKAHANVMFVAPGITADLLAHPDIQILQQKSLAGKYSVHTQFYPEDTAARLTSIATGKSPKEHQIVGRTWSQAHFGKTVAFKANALPKVASLAATHASYYEGQTVAISGSSDFAYAAALGVYPFDHHTATHLSYFYNNNNERVENLYDGSVLITREEIVHKVSIRKFPVANANFKWSPNSRELIANIKDIIAVFDLQDKESLAMFADFEIAYAAVELLKSNAALKAAVADHVHDLYSFVFPGVRAVYDRFGAQSSQGIAALYLFDAVVSEITQQLSALYGDKLASEVLFLQKPASTDLNTNVDFKEAVYAVAKQYVGSAQQFGEFFPAVYAKDDASAQSLCTALQSFRYTHNVHCFERDHRVFARMREEYVRQVQLTNNDVAIFQIVLWFSIILFLAVFVVVYSVINMDTKLDLLMRGGPVATGAAKPHAQ